MILVGVSGPIGHGKSTLSKTLLAQEKNSRHLEISMIISDIANLWLDDLPDDLISNPMDIASLNLWLASLSEIINDNLRQVEFSQLETSKTEIEKNPDDFNKLFMFLDLIKQGLINRGKSIDQNNKDLYRSLLQWLGGYLIQRVSPSVWADEVQKRIEQAKKNNIHIFLVGGLRFKHDSDLIKKNGGYVVQVIRTGLLVRDSNEFTEKDRTKIRPDANVINDATVEALIETTKAIYHDLKTGRLLQEYKCSDFDF